MQQQTLTMASLNSKKKTFSNATRFCSFPISLYLLTQTHSGSASYIDTLKVQANAINVGSHVKYTGSKVKRLTTHNNELYSNLFTECNV